MPLYLDYDLGAPQDVEDQEDVNIEYYAEDESNESPEFLKKNQKREKNHQKSKQIKG